MDTGVLTSSFFTVKVAFEPEKMDAHDVNSNVAAAQTK